MSESLVTIDMSPLTRCWKRGSNGRTSAAEADAALPSPIPAASRAANALVDPRVLIGCQGSRPAEDVTGTKRSYRPYTETGPGAIHGAAAVDRAGDRGGVRGVRGRLSARRPHHTGSLERPSGRPPDGSVRCSGSVAGTAGRLPMRGSVAEATAAPAKIRCRHVPTAVEAFWCVPGKLLRKSGAAYSFPATSYGRPQFRPAEWC